MQKILLAGNNHLLGDKLYEVLNREHKVFEIQYKNKLNNEDNNKLFDLEKIMARIILEEVEVVIFSSEVFIDYIEDYSIEDLKSWFKQFLYKCMLNNLKFVYLDVKMVLETNTIEKPYYKNNRSKYKDINSYSVNSLQYILDNSLVFEMDTVYGNEDKVGIKDFTNYIPDNNGQSKEIVYDDIEKLVPVLIDEAAIFISENLDKEGRHIIVSEDKISLKEWRENNNIINGLKVKEHQKNCAFKLIYKYEAQDYLENQSIAEVRFQLGQTLSNVIPDDVKRKIDFVCPVPKTGIYYAMGLAEEMKIPYIQALIKTDPKERSFQIADVDVRKKFLWSKIRPIPELIKDKCIAIVDEAIFTGTTLKVVCEMLWECEVKEIYLCIPTPRCQFHCEYFVHPNRPMLLEYLKEEMLNDYFNVKEIFFQDDNNFNSALKLFNNRMCAECFWGGNL